MGSHIERPPKQLPDELRESLIAARRARGWSQAELGRRLHLPQAHISGIETGRIVPRYDTLLELVRTLEHDLVLVPRPMVPVVRAILRDHAAGDEERPLYLPDEESPE
jgi:transcriptional regulator with XRE-family HTH domain